LLDIFWEMAWLFWSWFCFDFQRTFKLLKKKTASR
jgi:hypothetical protein